MCDPPDSFLARVNRILDPEDGEQEEWRKAIAEPLWLLAEFFRSWHATVDVAAWKLTDLANELEKVQTPSQHHRDSSLLTTLDYLRRGQKG